MSSTNTAMRLPEYNHFIASIEALDLPISGSELHGVMCGYLATTHARAGENYLRALMLNRKEDTYREAAKALFSVYAVSQQQIANMEFEVEFIMPDEEATLFDRARAFSEWCEGFVQAVTVTGVDIDSLKTDEAQEAIVHLTEFAALDYDALIVSEEDERALTEVIEYTRMAILHIYADMVADKLGGEETTH